MDFAVYLTDDKVNFIPYHLYISYILAIYTFQIIVAT